MKTFNYILLSLMVFFTINAFSYPPPDSCLTLIDYNSSDTTFDNLDSIKIDTCISSSTYLKEYGKRFFNIEFEYNIIPKGGIFPADTIIEYTWRDIDSIYLSTMLAFKQLEIDYGTFYFREPFPDKFDTSQFIKRKLWLRFEDYKCIDSVINDISAIPNVASVLFTGHPYIVTHTLIADDGNSISYNSASQVLTINAQSTAFQTPLQIFNLSGAVVMTVPISQKTQNIDLSSLSRGFYIIRFRESVAKIIVQ